MGIWAVVSKTTMIVENLIIWDGQTPWTPPEGFEAVDTRGQYVESGYTYDPVNDVFIGPPEPE